MTVFWVSGQKPVIVVRKLVRPTVLSFMIPFLDVSIKLYITNYKTVNAFVGLLAPLRHLCLCLKGRYGLRHGNDRYGGTFILLVAGIRGS